MTIDALNDLPRGGTWIKLRVKGDKITGKLLDAEFRNRTDLDGKPVMSRKTGNPRRELVLTIQCASEGPDDDGIRKVSLNESAQRALSAANPSGRWERNGDIYIAVTADPEGPMDQATYGAKYKAPAVSLVLDDEAPF